jgi:hypothetical protein
MTVLEDRLRAALAAKSEAVTLTDEQLAETVPDDVVWLVPGSTGRPQRRYTTLVVALAAAVIAALAVGVTALSVARHTGTPRPLLAANQQADRSKIPWNQVGQGWTLALWTAATLTSEQEITAVQSQTVYLVNPIGGRYLITTLTGDHSLRLADWSTDVRTALLTRQGGTSSEVIRLDLASGKTESFTAAGRVRLAKFTKPSGAAILLESASGAVMRVSLAGDHQLTYPFSRTTDDINAYHPLSSPDGHTIVLDSDQGLVVRAEDGSLRRTIAPPPGRTVCSPLQWWDADSILASCLRALGGQGPELYVVPVLVPGPMTPLIATPTSGDNPFTLAWRLDSGVLLLNEATDCGTETLGQLDSTGHIVARATPAGLGGHGLEPVGATASAVTFKLTLDCDRNHTRALVSFDPGSNQVTRLLGPGLNGGSVLDAYGFGDTIYYSGIAG